MNEEQILLAIASMKTEIEKSKAESKPGDKIPIEQYHMTVDMLIPVIETLVEKLQEATSGE